MLHYLKFAGMFFGILALAPFVLGVLSVVAGGVGLWLLVFGLMTVVVALAIGAVVLFMHGLRCASEEPVPLHRAVAVLASPVLTLIVVQVILPLAAFGHFVGSLANAAQPAPPIAMHSSAP